MQVHQEEMIPKDPKKSLSWEKAESDDLGPIWGRFCSRMIRTVADCSKTLFPKVTLLAWLNVFSLQVGGIQWLTVPAGWPGLGEHQFSNEKMDSRLAKNQYMCILLPACSWTPWGHQLCLAPERQPSLKILRMWLIISLLHFFFQLKLSLRSQFPCL